MLRYCGWCGKFMGANRARGHQIGPDLCAIDTTSICPSCLASMVGDQQRQRKEERTRPN
ncbi:hypothetical protein [Geothermobacter ehrlichii]|uniref:hypothetical protein n=1 Tax=Geothermobacter ehrlichii TaxID=213224 RepID=UPI001652E2A4|nr:hypothetical protein [Geothermobacter ehrlichii]